MKQRIISAIVALAICIYPLLFGGLSLKILIAFVAVVGVYEMTNATFGKIEPLIMVPMILYIASVNLRHIVSSSFALILAVWLFFAAISIERLSFDKISGCFIVSEILAHAVYFVIALYDGGRKEMFFYVLIAAFACDTFAYFGGRFFGKHKMNERVSPKKTIEGALIGWACSAVLSFAFAAYFSFFNEPMIVIAVSSLVLPIVSEIGDLAFSLIKRHYGIKDFGNIMPGHGGVLDRLDSVLFCLITLSSILSILL